MVAKQELKDGVPKIFDLLYPTLRALIKLGGSGRILEIVNTISDNLDIDDEVLSFRRSENHPILYEWRCAWARTYLKNAGAVENTSRGVWAITPQGRKLRPRDMTGIWRKARDVAAKRAEQKRQPTPEEDSDTGEQPTWKKELLDALRTMPPDGFERLAQRMLREKGFSRVEVTGKSGDGGIDGTGVLEIELISFKVLFQCKRYSKSVDPAAIRDFRGAMVGRADKGIFVTTGSFSKNALIEATRDGATTIDLIDGEELCEILKNLELGVKVTTSKVEDIEVDPSFFKAI